MRHIPPGSVHRGQRVGHLGETDGAGDQLAGTQHPGADQSEQLRIGVRGHAVTAAHLQLVRDDEFHRQGRAALGGGQQPDLHVASAPP